MIQLTEHVVRPHAPTKQAQGVAVSGHQSAAMAVKALELHLSVLAHTA